MKNFMTLLKRFIPEVARQTCGTTDSIRTLSILDPTDSKSAFAINGGHLRLSGDVPSQDRLSKRPEIDWKFGCSRFAFKRYGVKRQ